MSISTMLPEIYTERTVVRLATREDRDSVLEYYSDNKERLTPFTPSWPNGFFTKTFWERQIDRNLEEYYADVSCRLFIFDSADQRNTIGNVSLGGVLRAAAQFAYLGYGVCHKYEGKGYAFEGVSALVQYGFDELNLHRIMANYMPTNARSGALLKRMGFTVEGYARDYLHLNGKWEDHIMTSRTNPNWKDYSA